MRKHQRIPNVDFSANNLYYYVKHLHKFSSVPGGHLIQQNFHSLKGEVFWKVKSLLRQAFFPPSQYHRISAGYHDNLLKKNIFYECLAFNSPLRECNRLGVGGVPITSTPWLCFGWTLTSEPKGRLFQEQLVLRAIPLAYYPPVLINTGKLVQTGLHVLQSGRRERNGGHLAPPTL